MEDVNYLMTESTGPQASWRQGQNKEIPCSLIISQSENLAHLINALWEPTLQPGL